MKRWLHIAVLCAASVCVSCKGPTAIAHAMGTAGWAQINRPGGKAAFHKYKDHFTLTSLGDADDPGCDSLELAPTGPVVVLVHGIRGDGVEMEDAVPVIAASHPAGFFMFRWMPFERLDEISDGLSLGLSRLLACRPGQEVVVVAHSAGGLIASAAASMVVIPRDAPDGVLKVMTVASPLAGTMHRRRHENGDNENHFILDLGTQVVSYKPVPRGVSVVHLRSQYPSDPVMKPKGNLIPNDPSVGVPGAPQIDLPAVLGHMGALAYVVRQIADGSWREYFRQRGTPATAHAAPGR